MNRFTNLALACAVLLPSCAQVIAAPSDQLKVPVDADLQKLADAAVTLIEARKLLPLADALRDLGPEPDPRVVAQTIERLLRD